MFPFYFIEFVFPLFFLLFFVVFLYSVIQNVRQWNKNNHSPRLTVDAKVVAKRADTTVHHHSHGANGGMSTSHSTSYYATFEVESGDRMEFNVSGTEYGQLAEGDVGCLHFQGTRYLEFVRN